ncbi:hypothetical protein P154DRAFT_543976 [Amniculicola lignicola CBS 123094]|uniref:Uncharacterized protein n=1 Tax=Amniculicola lignicola CBS 123094 TaxID=1392246 RepID=A0A6A5WSY2_9PLEO|nr:hypothetical protein P154DRAFT_543976 [Amniculicola lignicola CBS 123094]
MFDAGNCAVVPDTTTTDAGVAGAGTLLSYIITNFISLTLSATIILLNYKKSTSAPIPRKLLLSFSDQQIVTGIGIQSIALSKMKSMTPYHFFIVWLLAMLSTATNLSTLLALVNDFKRDWVLRWMRQFFMLVNLVLGCLMGIFILQSVMKDVEPRLPIACVWKVAARGTPSNGAVSIVGTIAVISANAILFVASTWYLHMRRNPQWIKTVQVIGLIMLIAMGVGATVRIIMISQAFGTPPASVRLVGTSEKDWGYGQLLSLLLLVLPVISTVEIIRGETRIPTSSVDEEVRPLFQDGEMAVGGNEGYEFQPNPLWGSRTQLVKG